MQIALTMRHTGGNYPQWGQPVFVRSLDMRRHRPCIHTHPLPCDVQDDTSPESLELILSEIVARRGSPFCGYRIETSDNFAIVGEA